LRYYDFVKRKWETVSSRWNLFSFVAIGILLLGFSLLALYSITSNSSFLIYAGILSISLITLLIFLFASLGMKFGFFVHMEIDGEFDFSMMIMYLLYVGLTIGIMAVQTF
tara:strand:+ start:1826 stop:2155 length:330 start_codon:yes stop_codon:yes gene_type:complete